MMLSILSSVRPAYVCPPLLLSSQCSNQCSLVISQSPASSTNQSRLPIFPSPDCIIIATPRWQYQETRTVHCTRYSTTLALQPWLGGAEDPTQARLPILAKPWKVTDTDSKDPILRYKAVIAASALTCRYAAVSPGLTASIIGLPRTFLGLAAL